MFNEVVALYFNEFLDFFCLNVVEEAVVDSRSLVFERRRAVADFRPTNDPRLVDLRPLHRGHDLFTVRLLSLDGAIRQRPMELGSGVGVESSGDCEVHWLLS